MTKLNHHYQKLSPHYLFADIEQRVQAFRQAHPDTPLIHLGIGDVTQPLPAAAAEALLDASREMGARVHGYGPSQGYPFLREAIAAHDYAGLGIDPDEIFISNGAKCDIGNLQELFDPANRVALPDPAYPVYLDTTVMAGRTRPLLKSGRFGGLTYLPCIEKNDFRPLPPSTHVDLIYLCSPHNPTGVALDRPTLEAWVQYARAHDAIILFDGAYEAYIQSDCPRSIYEIAGAHEVAVEIRSFSKNGGFTGLRCSYTVIPHTLIVRDSGQHHSLHALWKRRHDTKFNGVPYPVQRAAAALYTDAGHRQMRALIADYQTRAHTLLSGLTSRGHTVYGGHDAPYLWWKAPISSWDFFDHLLHHAHIISTPGIGFGLHGDGFVRLSAFAPLDTIHTALASL